MYLCAYAFIQYFKVTSILRYSAFIFAPGILLIVAVISENDSSESDFATVNN